jgi:hypothetical protein
MVSGRLVRPLMRLTAAVHTAAGRRLLLAALISLGVAPGHPRLGVVRGERGCLLAPDEIHEHSDRLMRLGYRSQDRHGSIPRCNHVFAVGCHPRPEMQKIGVENCGGIPSLETSLERTQVGPEAGYG